MRTLYSKRSTASLPTPKTSKHLLKKRSFLGALVLIGVFLLALPAQQSSAVGSSVEVNVNNQTALVFVTMLNASEVTASNNTIQTNMAFSRLRGPVNKLLQLRIYVDNNYVATVPLTPLMTEFSYDLELEPGTHTVLVEGVSANESPDPSYSFTVQYTPSIVSPGTVTPTPPPSNGQGVTIDSTATVEQVPSPSEVNLQLPPWLYNTLITLDIASPTSSGTSIKLGFWRPILLIISILAITFAPWILKTYRHLRYTWLGWHGQPLPAALRRHPLFWIRLSGVVLLIGSLLFI